MSYLAEIRTPASPLAAPADLAAATDARIAPAVCRIAQSDTRLGTTAAQG